ncbi:MAG: PKD domain-containing protein [Bacteroidales bacterium]
MKDIKTLFILFIIFSGCAGSRQSLQSDYYSAEITPFSSNHYDEYSPVMYQNKIIFCSNRNDDLFIKHFNEDNRENFNIYSLNIHDTSSWRNYSLFDKNLVSHFNDGPVTFDPAQEVMYYSRNLTIDRKKNKLSGPNTLGIFSARKLYSHWTDIKTFPYNSPKYHNTTPYYDTSNRRLYFASTMPGGYGQSDLYYSEKTDEGWSKPVNLGPRVNTEGNELYPFITASGKLFFSSDGHGGLGKKDIFLTEKEDGEWIKPVHLKPPINSKDDDFALVTDHTFQSGYFSSNRKQSDDIYRFRTKRPQFYNCDSLEQDKYCFQFQEESYPEIDSLSRFVWNFSDGTKVNGKEVTHCFPGPGKYRVQLNIEDQQSDSIYYTQSEYEFEVEAKAEPHIRSRDAYIVNEKMEFDGSESGLPDLDSVNYYWDFGEGTLGNGLSADHTYKKKGKYKVMLGVTGINDSTGFMENHCVWKNVQVLEDYQALATYQAGEKEKGIDMKKTLPDTDSSDMDSDKVAFEEVEIRSYVIAELPKELANQLNEAFGAIDQTKLAFNDTELEEISYPVLNRIIRIVKKYSMTKVEIAVHSDNRGSAKNNKDLTEERAQAIRDYLASQGVTEERLQATGYGESRPIAGNETRAGRQKNKRVEFILINR